VSGQIRLAGPQQRGRLSQMLGLGQHGEPPEIFDIHTTSVSITVVGGILRM
jgi:hypothetical protein